MTPSEELHLNAAAYAHLRIEKHNEALKIQKLKPLTQKQSVGFWLAYYEGYVAGHEVASKELNHG